MDFSTIDKHFMQQALNHAREAASCDEVPVGAGLVKNDEMIAGAFNQPITLHDPTAHAEMLCLRQAGLTLQNYRLIDTTLYVTLEPCAMCAMALVHARIKRLVYATPAPRTGAVQSVLSLTNHPDFNHQIDVSSGLFAGEAGQLLQDFFKQKRR